MEACNNIVDRIAKDMHNFRNEISAVMHSVSPHCIVLWREDSSFPLETWLEKASRGFDVGFWATAGSTKSSTVCFSEDIFWDGCDSRWNQLQVWTVLAILNILEHRNTLFVFDVSCENEKRGEYDVFRLLIEMPHKRGFHLIGTIKHTFKSVVCGSSGIREFSGSMQRVWCTAVWKRLGETRVRHDGNIRHTTKYIKMPHHQPNYSQWPSRLISVVNGWVGCDSSPTVAATCNRQLVIGICISRRWFTYWQCTCRHGCTKVMWFALYNVFTWLVIDDKDTKKGSG